MIESALWFLAGFATFPVASSVAAKIREHERARLAEKAKDHRARVDTWNGDYAEKPGLWWSGNSHADRFDLKVSNLDLGKEFWAMNDGSTYELVNAALSHLPEGWRVVTAARVTWVDDGPETEKSPGTERSGT